MKRKFLMGLVGCLLLLCGTAVPATACCEGEPPGDCYRCEDGVWVQYGDCWGGCPECESCEDCYCECTSECCEDSDCGDPNCWNCEDCECECNASIESVTSDEAFVCVGCNVTFTVQTKPADCNSAVTWSGGGDPSGGSGATFSTHWDTPGTYTVTATCFGSGSKQVIIVGVDKVVEEGTTDEGPLYVCLDDTVDLEAKPNPAGAPFPSGEPHWSIESQPEGANASLTPSSGSATTTLSGLDRPGKYVVKAKCGASDTGDTIDVYVGGSSYRWQDWDPPFSCGPDDPENQSFITDDCHNWLSIYCDSTNHLNAKAFSWWYTEGAPPGEDRGTEIGCCVWKGGLNAGRYKETYPEKRIFLETITASCNDSNWDVFGDEGCLGYWCYRYVWFDCIWHSKVVVWRRDGESSVCPCSQGVPDTEYDEPCPGPGRPLRLKHPGWPD